MNTPMTINTDNDDYKLTRKKKCTNCKSTEYLTVHHIIPQDMIKLRGINTITEKDLSTLCRSCHTRYEETADIFRKRLQETCPVYDKLCGLKSVHNMMSRKKQSVAGAKGYLVAFSIWFTQPIDRLEDLPEYFGKLPDTAHDVLPIKTLSTLWHNHYKQWRREEKALREAMQLVGMYNQYAGVES